MRNFDELTVCVMVNEVNWNCEKARCIVNDVYRYFDKNDGAYPKPDTIQNIRFGFNEIAMKLSVVFDLLDKVKDSVKLVDYERDNDVEGVKDS